MKEIAVLLLISTIFSTTKETHGVKIWGPRTNFTELLWKIWLKGSNQLVPNLLPDMTYNDKTRQRRPGYDASVGRRFLKNILADRRKQIQHNVDKDLGSENAGFVLAEENLHGTGSSTLEDIGNRILRTAQLSGRRLEEHRRKKDENDLLKRQHYRKMIEIKSFLDSNYLSTDYIYNEVQRIKRDHVIKDPLRKMVDYLSRPHMDELAKSVFKCFQDKRKIDIPSKDVWKNSITNNLLINTLKNPLNDGIIN